jgi:Na+-transporting NADH:ubiquinone oxidoreductase subunit NqrC
MLYIDVLVGKHQLKHLGIICLIISVKANILTINPIQQQNYLCDGQLQTVQIAKLPEENNQVIVYVEDQMIVGEKNIMAEPGIVLEYYYSKFRKEQVEIIVIHKY